MSKWIDSSHQTKRKRPEDNNEWSMYEQHAQQLSKRSENSSEWSRYEPSSNGQQPMRRPFSHVSNAPQRHTYLAPAAAVVKGGPKAAFLSPYAKTSHSSSAASNPCSKDELPKALVESYRNNSSKRNGLATAATRVTLPPQVCGSLNAEQRNVVETVLSGEHSVFFTGPAGCGKTFVLNSILQLNEQAEIAPTRRIIVTATTGIAACALGGVTIHSFAGVGTGVGKESEIVGKVMGNHQAVQRWRQCDCLIIDEISMMSADFFDLLHAVACRTRNSRQIFGGMQVVVCGDFFQLPPIGDLRSSVSTIKFAFEAKCWPKAFAPNSILLKQVFRQSGDTQFLTLLNEARLGELSPESTNLLRAHSMIPPRTDYEVQPTLLECRNHQVDQSNSVEMTKLLGAEERVFLAKDFSINKSYSTQLKQCSAQERLVLKVGALVIMLKNIDPENGLVNGTRGVVVDFQKSSKKSADLPKEFRSVGLPVVQFESVSSRKAHDDDKDDEKKDSRRIIVEPVEWTSKVGDTIVFSRVQIPLRLAWALSVHKSQGMTIPHLSISLKGVFEYGQAYVALSRATELKNLVLSGFHERAFVAHPRVKAFYRLLMGTYEDAGEKTMSQSEKRNCLASMATEKKSSTSLSVTDIEWTPEQLQRMETNKQRAILLRQQKEKNDQGNYTIDLT